MNEGAYGTRMCMAEHAECAWRTVEIGAGGKSTACRRILKKEEKNMLYHIGVIIISSIAVLILLYLLAVIPRILYRPDRSPLMGSYYAHRGLHDNLGEAPENSMAAFRKAVDAGYGIELDVQLTKDKIPVVFHDETLIRICGAQGKVRDFTYEELQQFTLCKSGERIPLLADFLKMVDGKVPLIIEIKAYEKAGRVCTEADKLIRQYKGKYCIESFDPRAVRWYRMHRPEVVRGQLSTDFNRPGCRESAVLFMIQYLLTNWLCRPDFIAYDHHYKKNLSRKIVCNLFGALSVAWTIRSQKELELARDSYELFIFEGFIPAE